ncbi:hypothetical protein AB0942_28955 [Streptomyces nodosus]|uniref:hypothetical protein n=1 Tax=Streptomyces nodosus TaxID=40318 RepID=UPI0034527145
MNLVFKADGLSVGEGAFLLACCNHTDDRGYVIAHMRQLADEAHMKMTAAKANKQRLIQRGLLAAGERYSPKNGARIADLYRVNLTLLASMERARKDYGPSLVEELSFADPQETPSSAPPSESDPGAGPDADPPPSESDGGGSDSDGALSESDGRRGSESDPLLPPSSAPSSLSPRAGDADASGVNSPVGERESKASPGGQNPSGAELPPQRKGSNQSAAAGVGRIMGAYSAALGRPVLNGTRAKLERQAVELLAQGLPEAWLCDRARELAARGWSDLVRHAERSTVPVEVRRDEPGSGRPGLPEWCGECGDGTGTAARLNPRFRKVGPEDARELCPRCHPDRVGPATA